MSDVLIEHERRLTALELTAGAKLATLEARLLRLEETAAQAAVDREQADRRQLAELRGRLEAAETEARRLRDGAAVLDASSAMVASKRA